jgi:hypothetical protein
MCPGGLSPEEWDEAIELAERTLAMSDGTGKEYGGFVQSAGGHAYSNRIYGGGAARRVMGTEYYGRDLPRRDPPGSVAFIHSHPTLRTESGAIIGGNPVSDGDIDGARERNIPYFVATRSGVFILLPNATEYLPKSWPLGAILFT